MSTYKIHRGPDGAVKNIGPNTDEFQPCLDDGDTLEFADELPANVLPEYIPPVIITSDSVTIPDAELLMTAAKSGDKTAAWLIAKLEL